MLMVVSRFASKGAGTMACIPRQSCIKPLSAQQLQTRLHHARINDRRTLSHRMLSVQCRIITTLNVETLGPTWSGYLPTRWSAKAGFHIARPGGIWMLTSTQHRMGNFGDSSCCKEVCRLMHACHACASEAHVAVCLCCSLLAGDPLICHEQSCSTVALTWHVQTCCAGPLIQQHELFMGVLHNV